MICKNVTPCLLLVTNSCLLQAPRAGDPLTQEILGVSTDAVTGYLVIPCRPWVEQHCPVLYLSGFIVAVCIHTFYIVKHCKHAKVSKAGTETVQTTASQISLSTVSENEKCTILNLTSLSVQFLYLVFPTLLQELTHKYE